MKPEAQHTPMPDINLSIAQRVFEDAFTSSKTNSVPASVGVWLWAWSPKLLAAHASLTQRVAEQDERIARMEQNLTDAAEGNLRKAERIATLERALGDCVWRMRQDEYLTGESTALLKAEAALRREPREG